MQDITKWVRKFQRISWEPEILISGGILFTLFQTQSALVLIKGLLYPLGVPGLTPLMGFFAFGVSALTVGFSLHLITKAFWIALLALKSVYPNGINIAKLNYSEYFLKKISLDPSLDSTISKIGNTSSLMFVISFLFLLIFFGIGTYMIMISGLLYFIPLELLPFRVPVVSLVVFSLIIPFIDFLTLGSLKKVKIISKIYYPYYKLISWMTLSFLYRDILYTLFSNVSKRKLTLFTLLFIIPTAMLGYRNVAGVVHAPTAFNDWYFFENTFNNSIGESRYENLRGSGDPIGSGTIQSDVINEQHIKLYLRYQNWMDWQLKELSDSLGVLRHNKTMNIFFDIKVDNKSIDSVVWNFTRKTDINQFGIIGYIPIPDLEYGPHVIEVFTNKETLFVAPFWKE